jgi:aromatic ring-opening dioxygenase catalytic subunit (LigB family)
LNAGGPVVVFNDDMNTTLPSLFVSHGSPMTALNPGAAGDAWSRLGPAIDATFGRPKAILAVSAHSLTRQPVLPLAWVPTQSPAQQFALGEALQPLADEGVLVIGTGSITHNLRLLSRFTDDSATDQPERTESRAFRDWFVARSAERDWDALLAYRSEAPHAALMHPTDEHLLPWYVAAGAGGRGHAPLRVHDSNVYGALGMDAYAFGAPAPRLAAALSA